MSNSKNATYNNDEIVLRGVLMRPQEHISNDGLKYHTFTLKTAKQLGEDLTSVVSNFFHVVVPSANFIDGRELSAMKGKIVLARLSPKCSTRELKEGYIVNNFTLYLVAIEKAEVEAMV
jgi:hypothetical protein